MLYPDLFHWKHNVTSYILKELNACIRCSTTDAQNLVQARFLALPTFRTKFGGTAYHKFGVSPVGLKKMTCHERCAAVMLYPYALGSRCLVLPTGLRAPAMEAMRLGQVMLVAIGNARPLTNQEARAVFVACGRRLFVVLGELHFRTTAIRIARTRQGCGRRRPHLACDRDALESEGSIGTAAEEANPPGHTRYVRSHMAIPGHCFDFPEIYRRSGGVHNHTAHIGESTHPLVIRRSYNESGKQGGADALRGRMTDHVIDMTCWNDIHKTVPTIGPERRPAKRKRNGLSSRFTASRVPVATQQVLRAITPLYTRCA